LHYKAALDNRGNATDGEPSPQLFVMDILRASVDAVAVILVFCTVITT
jgi:hypothetical protein